MRPTAVAVLSDGRIAVVELGAAPEDAAGKGRLSLWRRWLARRGVEGSTSPEGSVPTATAACWSPRPSATASLRVGRAAGPVGEIGARRFTRPMGTDLDPRGRLLVADTYANRVLRFESPAVSEPGAPAARWRPRWC